MYKQALLALVGGILFSAGESADARVFSYKEATLAPFIRGSGGLSQLGQDAFANANSSTAVEGDSPYQYGGELGLMMAVSTRLNLTLGAEVIQHSTYSSAPGTNAAGTELYKLDSSVFIFNPNVGLEYIHGQSGSLRYSAKVSVGMANVTVVNGYKMTPAGETALGVESFDEKMQANVISSSLGLGLETLFTDNVTFFTDLGYRFLQVKGLQHKSNTQTLVSPEGVSAGDDAVNGDGSARKLNLSGFYLGVGFRFYLTFL